MELQGGRSRKARGVCTVHCPCTVASGTGKVVGEGLAGLCQSAGRSVGRSAGRSLSVDHRGGGSCHGGEQEGGKEARRHGGFSSVQLVDGSVLGPGSFLTSAGLWLQTARRSALH